MLRLDVALELIQGSERVVQDPVLQVLWLLSHCSQAGTKDQQVRTSVVLFLSTKDGSKKIFGRLARSVEGRECRGHSATRLTVQQELWKSLRLFCLNSCKSTLQRSNLTRTTLAELSYHSGMDHLNF